MMADAKHLLEFLEGSIGMLFDLGLEFLRVEFAPVSPACFRGQRARFGGLQIPINGTPGQVKPPGGFGFGAARFNEVHHPFPQVQRISFHALKPITLCPNVNMKCYRNTARRFLDLYYDLPHLFPLPKERTCQRKIYDWRKIIRLIQSHDIPKTRRMILLLPGKEGRDEGERSNHSCPKFILLRIRLLPLSVQSLTDASEQVLRQIRLLQKQCSFV